MNAAASRHEQLLAIVGEHEDLMLRIQAERIWWEQLREYGDPLFGEMGARLRDFRQRLASHFEHEEQLERETFADPGQSVPGELRHLPQEHQDFLGQLDEISGQLTRCDESYDCWGRAGDVFARFTQALEEHEQGELTALQRLLRGASWPKTYIV